MKVIKSAKLLALTFFVFNLTTNAQNLTISSTGQTGTSGTNWSLTSNTINVTGDADINVSVINDKLVSSNLSFSGVRNLSVTASISWSSNSNLTLIATQNILIYSDISVSGATAELYIYYGGSNNSTAPNNSYIYSLSQRNRSKINFTNTSSILKIGNETYTLCNNLSQLTNILSSATNTTKVAMGDNVNLNQTYTNSLFPINFSGKFDGLGHVIDGLKIRNSGGVSTKSNLGLFSQLQGATVRNLGITNIDILTNSTIANTSGSEFRVGALAGNIGDSSLASTGYSASAYTTNIESVWTSGNIGTANNFSSDTQSNGDRQKYFFAGGIVGSQNNGTANISRCYSYANVSSSGSYADNIAIGGLIGDVGKNIVFSNFTPATAAELKLNLSKSFTTGSILSGTNGAYFGTGGLIGVLFASGSTISNCFSWGSAISTGSFGGLIGYVTDGPNGTITNSYTTQSVAGAIPTNCIQNVYTGVTATSPSTGTNLPAGFNNTIWSKVNGGLPYLLDLETPPSIIYVKVTTGQSSACGAVTIPYTLTDASGNIVTLSTLGLAAPSGTPVFTINNSSAPGSYSAVSYLSGLTLTGTNASNYTLNPLPTTTSTHTITGSCTNYQITLNGNSNTSGTAPANITFTSSTTIPSQGSLLKLGSTFLGWNTAANGSGTSYSVGATYATSSNLTLYAQWTANTLVVSYNTQGGTSISNGSTITGGSISTSPGTPTQLGYSFSGWFTSVSGGTAITFPYSHGQTSDFTLYAQWTANNNTITFNANSGSGSMSNQTIATGAFTNLNTNTFTRTGFTFAGWNTLAAGTGSSYADGANYTMGTSNVTLYAQWTVNCNQTTSSSSIKLANGSMHVTILSAQSNWVISGGANQGLFSISNNNILSFSSAANYDNNSSNIYLVNVTNGCDTKNLTITISPLCGKW